MTLPHAILTTGPDAEATDTDFSEVNLLKEEIAKWRKGNNDWHNIFAFPTAPRDESSGWRLTPAKLVDARTAALLNQSELAALVGVRRQAILSYEQGVKSPEPETMAAIAKEQT